ncbi:MAG TPA: glutamine--tRNA ligase, partial [Helicobacteraceae bacterium]|nr:glutamine--tRNA ligase [Helicobacteraceae bacterium]
KIVGLKDSWGKKKKPVSNTPKPETKKAQIDGEVTAMTPEQQQRFDTYTSTLHLNSEVANTLARDTDLSNFFEAALAAHNAPVTVANIVSNEVARELKQIPLDSLKFTAKQVAQLASMIEDETISTKIAKQVFETMTQSGKDPAEIVKEQGLVQISDPKEIEPIIDEVMAKNPDNVAKFKAGNTKLLGFFVGQVLKATGGKANPQVVNQLVAQKLK